MSVTVYPQLHSHSSVGGMWPMEEVARSQTIIFLDLLKKTKKGKKLTILREPPVRGLVSKANEEAGMKEAEKKVRRWQNVPPMRWLLGILKLENPEDLAVVINSPEEMKFVRKFAKGEWDMNDLKEHPLALSFVLQLGSYGADKILSEYGKGKDNKVNVKVELAETISSAEALRRSLSNQVIKLGKFTGYDYKPGQMTETFIGPMMYNLLYSFESMYDSRTGKLSDEAFKKVNETREKRNMPPLNSKEKQDLTKLIRESITLTGRERAALEKAENHTKEGDVAILYGVMHNFIRHSPNFPGMKIKEFGESLEHAASSLDKMPSSNMLGSAEDFVLTTKQKRRMSVPDYRKKS